MAAAAAPTAERSNEGYAKATVARDGGKRLEEVVIKPSANGGFIVREQYRRTREGKRAMSMPDYLPPEQEMTFETFESMVGGLRKCFGVKTEKGKAA